MFWYKPPSSPTPRRKKQKKNHRLYVLHNMLLRRDEGGGVTLCTVETALLAKRRQRLIPFCGILVEIKDLIMCKSKTCQWCLYPLYSPINLCYPWRYIPLEWNCYFLFYKYAAVMLSLVLRHVFFQQSYENHEIWKFRVNS